MPTVALLLLLRKCLTDKGSKLDRTLLWFYFPVRICRWTSFRLGGFHHKCGSHLRRNVHCHTQEDPVDHSRGISGGGAVSSGWKEGVPDLVLGARRGRRSSRTSNVLAKRISFEVVRGTELNRQRLHRSTLVRKSRAYVSAASSVARARCNSQPNSFPGRPDLLLYGRLANPAFCMARQT